MKAVLMEPSQRGRAALGGGYGLVVALLLSSLRGAPFGKPPASAATTLGGVAFTLVFMSPFVLALAALPLRRVEQQRAIWFACGVLALALAAVTVFGIGVALLPAALLLFGAAWPGPRVRGLPSRWLPYMLAAWIITSFGVGQYALSSRSTPACWARDQTGGNWQRAAPGDAGALVGDASRNPCVSDIIDSREGTLGIAFIILGATGVTFTVWRWSSTAGVRGQRRTSPWMRASSTER